MFLKLKLLNKCTNDIADNEIFELKELQHLRLVKVRELDMRGNQILMQPDYKLFVLLFTYTDWRQNGGTSVQ